MGDAPWFSGMEAASSTSKYGYLVGSCKGKRYKNLKREKKMNHSKKRIGSVKGGPYYL
jgi:hypothetical protein